MFLKLRKPEKHAKVRINEHNTKEKPTMSQQLIIRVEPLKAGLLKALE